MKQKNILIIFVSLAVIVCAGIFLAYYVSHRSEHRGVVNSGLPMETVSIGGVLIDVEIASNDEQRELGLSNRASLAEGKGMLFVFDPPRDVGFWMKDMNFSLDMIFANTDGVILNIAHDVSPDTYPNQLFHSAGEVRYVLEVPAGYAEKEGIAVGQVIEVRK